MRRAFPVILGVLGLLLLAASAAWGLFSQAVANPAALALPRQIAGVGRTDYVTGPAAAREFENLHGKDFPITSGAVAIYGDNQITIWAAGAPLEPVAAQLVRSMHDRIAEGRSPFAEVGTLQDRGRAVYVLEGMGQKHYYFQSKNLVIWLAAEPAIADRSLQEILEAYP